MFPRKCSQPPWRNIDVTRLSQVKSAGTTANTATSWRSPWLVSDCS